MNNQQIAAAIVRHHLKSPEQRIQRFDREIAAARLEASQPHSQQEHLGLLMWELDSVAARDQIIEEMGREWSA